MASRWRVQAAWTVDGQRRSYAATTACGLPRAEVTAVAVDDVFGLSPTQCPQCAGRVADAAS